MSSTKCCSAGGTGVTSDRQAASAKFVLGAAVAIGTIIGATGALVAVVLRRRKRAADALLGAANGELKEPREHERQERIARELYAGVKNEAVQKEEQQKQRQEESEGSGGCGRNSGPLAAWQEKIHTASLTLNETLLALRGGSPSVRIELREICDSLSTTESLLQDAIYCTGKEAQIRWLFGELEPLFGPDASVRLLHPVTGEALRAQVIEALQSWEDHAP